MFFEVKHEFPQVLNYDFPADPKLCAQSLRNLFFAVALPEEFEDARANEVQTEHLAFANMENNCSILIVGGAHVIGNFHHGGLRR